MACQATKWGYEVSGRGIVIAIANVGGEEVDLVVSVRVWGLESWTNVVRLGVLMEQSQYGNGDRWSLEFHLLT